MVGRRIPQHDRGYPDLATDSAVHDRIIISDALDLLKLIRNQPRVPVPAPERLKDGRPVTSYFGDDRAYSTHQLSGSHVGREIEINGRIRRSNKLVRYSRSSPGRWGDA